MFVRLPPKPLVAFAPPPPPPPPLALAPPPPPPVFRKMVLRFVQLRLTQRCFFFPVPPNFGLSRQLWHVPQSARTQPSQTPHAPVRGTLEKGLPTDGPVLVGAQVEVPALVEVPAPAEAEALAEAERARAAAEREVERKLRESSEQFLTEIAELQEQVAERRLKEKHAELQEQVGNTSQEIAQLQEQVGTKNLGEEHWEHKQLESSS